MRKLTIGVASYRNPQRLQKTLQSIQRQSVTRFQCLIVHNPSGVDADGLEALQIARAVAANDLRFTTIEPGSNGGYAGAVNCLLDRAETEYIAYLDNDVEINTHGWDETLCSYLDRFHEIGMIFPNGGAYPIQRPGYTEVLWQAGFAWALSRACQKATGYFDEEIGHQEEADYCQRVRMAGWRCAIAPEVSVSHMATATNSPASIDRINRGVVNWVNKWNRYFNGVRFNYHSQNVTRFEDWPPNALYLEEYWQGKPELHWLNDQPEERIVDGREYDLIKVPRFKGFYRGRVI